MEIQDIKGTKEGIEVQIDYSCYISETTCFSPMERTTALYEGETLFEEIERGRQDYLSESGGNKFCEVKCIGAKKI